MVNKLKIWGRPTSQRRIARQRQRIIRRNRRDAWGRQQLRQVMLTKLAWNARP